MKNLFLRVTMTLALLAGCMTAFAQSTVKGTVKDAAGEAIIGAAVQVAGTHNGAITDIDGSFSLPGVQQGDKLEVSCIGYAGQTITWNGGVVNVVLEEDAEMLEGTIVTALGIRKDEKKVGYAVSSVSAESLNATVAPSLGTALYGKAAGVRVTTAPGGATGAISINVRGLSSITGTNQPLVIVDGVPIRNGEANKGDYWSVQRSESNGLADINVEDIENLTILKGASATSLYGSEGANGVILITMKQGKKNSGVHVDLNASVMADVVAYMPQYQTVYGPAYPYEFWSLVSGMVSDPSDPNYGFRVGVYTDRDGKAAIAPQNSYYYFGPKYDGRQVYSPTGYRSYNAITANPWSNLFRTGFTQQYNVAITQGGEHGNFRLSYTFMDNLPNQVNSKLSKHNFAVSGSQDVTSNGAVKINYSLNYMNQHVKNRPYRIARLVANYGGMFGAYDDIAAYRDRAVTSAGFKNRAYTSATHENPAEGWEYGPAVSALIDEYLWNIEGREQYETNQRFIGSVTPSWQIVKGLTLRGSIATDFTAQDTELKEHAETDPTLAGSYQGYYRVTKNSYQTIYGDAMLTYDTKIGKNFNFTGVLGYSARRENRLQVYANTNGGLTDLNHFHLNYSANTKGTGESTSALLRQAFFGTASFSFRDWAYLEGTLRNERSSTLYNQSYWYPSVNGSIILSELFRMPSWVDYGKFRVSYGIVGNAPEIYAAAMSYSQGTASGYIYQQLGASVGNDSIKPETTHEVEVGLEGKFFNNRLGFEVSYYHKRIVDQILNATAPRSAGGSDILMNVGELKNQGVEFAAYGTIIENRDWRLDLSGNIAWNRNEVVKLANGLTRLQHAKWDNGAAYLYSDVGQRMGDIYAYAPKTDDKGNKIVDSDGFYKVTDEPVLVGNAMPDLTGGFAITLGYKRFTLDANFSFQVGGAVWNQPYQYMMGLGAIKESLPGRGVEYGGMAFYTDANTGKNVAYTGTGVKGPNGETVHYDGVILPGVKEDGTPNDVIIGQELVLEETYSWGVGGTIYYSHSIFDNSYLKCRELSLSYSVPDSFTRKFKCNNLRLSVFARNPFFVYKNLPIFDAEATDGTRWTDQVQIGGSTSTTRTFGFTIRANF